MIINAVFLDYCGRSVSGRCVPKQYLLVRHTLVAGYVLSEKGLQVVRHKPDGHDKYTIYTHAKSRFMAIIYINCAGTPYLGT